MDADVRDRLTRNAPPVVDEPLPPPMNSAVFVAESSATGNIPDEHIASVPARVITHRTSCFPDRSIATDAEPVVVAITSHDSESRSSIR